MNKAKMTFRFDHNHSRNNSSGREIKQIQHKVIPLHQDEYRIGRGDKLLSDKTPAAIEQPEQGGVSGLHAKKLPEPFIDAQPLNQYTNDFGGWQSSFDIETQRVEKLIRESSSVNAANGETGYMDRQHYMDTKSEQIPGDEPLRDHHWYVPEETVYISRTSDSSWWKVFASVTGAVVTGVAFGFFVLSMFSGETEGTKGNSANPAPSGQTAAVSSIADGNAAKGDKNGTAQADKLGAAKTQTDKAETAKSQADTTAAASQSAAPVMAPVSSLAAAVTAVTIPGKSYSFLQSGIFSTSQGAETAVAALKKKGVTAVSDKGEKYPVYAGIALTRDDAAALAKQFQQKKTDVIIKNVELPALNKIKWTAKPSDALQNYIAQGDKLLQLIASLTLSHLTEAKLSAVSADALQSVKTAQQSWSGMSAVVNEGLVQDARASAQRMGGAMNAAISSLDEYKKNASTSVLWQTQEALMQYVLAQKELRKAVEAE